MEAPCICDCGDMFYLDDENGICNKVFCTVCLKKHDGVCEFCED